MSFVEIYEQKMSYSSKVNETHYAYTFHPQTSHLSSPYQFAIKAYSPDYEWGEYSDFHSAQQCKFHCFIICVAISSHGAW